MSGVHFIQQCPTCGRRVQVQLEYMGRRLACEHCHGGFTAGLEGENASDSVLNRATELLEDAESIRFGDKPMEEIW